MNSETEIGRKIACDNARGESGVTKRPGKKRDPARAGALLDLMIDSAAVNPKGFRSAPTGKKHKGRKIKKTAVEKLADATFGE
jgi:hypothetical protein